jgi:hypothetical protein
MARWRIAAKPGTSSFKTVSIATWRGKPDKLVLVIDMSAYTTQADFEHAFRQWKDKIVQDPHLWRQGWSLENLRLVIRDFADRYGHDILFAAHLSDGGGKKN